MRYKKLSKLVNCEICGQECRARGLQTHMRLKHQLITKVIKKVISVSEVINSDSSYNDSGEKLSEQIINTQEIGKNLGENFSPYSSHNRVDLGEKLSEGTVFTQVSDLVREVKPISRYHQGGNLGKGYLFWFKNYFLNHVEEAKAEWARLVETRFRAGHISWTKNQQSQALDFLSYGDSPLYYEFKKIKRNVTKTCMSEAEKFIIQHA